MAVTRYADAADLSVPEDALVGIHVDPAQRAAIINLALDRASEFADSYLSSRFQLPITAWGGDLRDQVGAIAAYRLLSKMGFQPGGEDSKDIRDRYDDAVKWFQDIARGRVTPTEIVDSSPSGTNNTDATGDARNVPMVLQSYPDGGVAEARDGFWERDSSTVPGVATGPSRNRGW